MSVEQVRVMQESLHFAQNPQKMVWCRSNLSRARDQSTDTGGKSSQASNPEKLHTDGIATSKGPSRVESSAQTIQGPSDRDRQIAVAGIAP